MVDICTANVERGVPKIPRPEQRWRPSDVASMGTHVLTCQILADPSSQVMSGVACDPLHGTSNDSSRAVHGNQLTELMVEVDDE